MRQVTCQIRVKSDQFGSKVHSILKMMQNEENRLTSVILKSNANTISMALVRGQVLSNIEVKWGQKVNLGGLIMIKGVK